MDEITFVIVAFNRPESLKRLLTTLNEIIVGKDEKVRLHISIDWRDNDVNNLETINLAKEFEWKYGEKIVDVKDKNYGLKKHVLYCGNLTDKYENIIVLEDDLIVSPQILNYAHQVLSYYKNDDMIAGMSMYSFQRNPANSYPFQALDNGSDVYFAQYACSWGQLWTKDKWNKFYNWYLKNENFNFKNSLIPNNIQNWGDKSWLKYHICYCIFENKYFVFPKNGLTSNFTECGTHNLESSNAYQCNLIYNQKEIVYKFEDFNDALNVYDAFFENIKLNKLLKIKDEIISDIYGEKIINSNKGLLLSSKKYNYKILDSYKLDMYSPELNIMYGIKGNDVFLYDLSSAESNKNKYDYYNIFKYFFKFENVPPKFKFLSIFKTGKKYLKRKLSRFL